jgi:hypothetical protein
MNDEDMENSSFFKKQELVHRAKTKPEEVPSLIRRQFFRIKEDCRKKHFAVNNKPNEFTFQSNEILPPGSMVIFYGCIFTSMYLLYMRPGGSKLFSWSRYSRSHRKNRENVNQQYSTKRQRYHHEWVRRNPDATHSRTLKNGEMSQAELDFVRSHMRALGMSTTKLDSCRSHKALCAKEIKGAYTKMSLRTHPDMIHKDASDFERKINLQKFQAASSAHEELQQFIKQKSDMHGAQNT